MGNMEKSLWDFTQNWDAEKREEQLNNEGIPKHYSLGRTIALVIIPIQDTLALELSEIGVKFVVI